MKTALHKIVLLWLLLFTLYSTGFSQREKIDSLQKILPTLKDTARIDCLELLAISYYRGHVLYGIDCGFDTAQILIDVMFAESKKIGHVHGIAASLYLRAALACLRDKNWPEAERLARESLKWYALTRNKKRIYFAYYHLGWSLFLKGLPDEGYPDLLQSYEWSEKQEDKFQMFWLQGIIYENYRDIGDYEKAFAAYEKVQQLQLRYEGKIDTFYQYYVLGELHRLIENFPTALNYYRKAIARIDLNHDNIWFRVGYPELFTLNGKFDSASYYYSQIDSTKLTKDEARFYLVSMGEFFSQEKKYGEALGYLLRGLKSCREANNVTQTRRALIDIARVYTGSADYEHALVYIREGLDLSLGARARQSIRDAYQVLYTIYQDRHETDSAFSYFKKYVAQKEIVANDVVKGKFAAYNYDQRIYQLNNEKLLQGEQIKQTDLQKQLLVAGIIVLLLLSVVVFRNIFLKRKNEANRREMAENELRLQKLEIAKTKAELQQEASELEMQALRAQMNPHFIFNCLSSINRFILMNESETASDYLTKFSRLVRMVLNNSQKESIPLEDELEMLRLYLDLERLRFKNAFDYSIVFNNNVDTASVYIPPLLIQPFAENAIWHGLMHKDDRGFIEISFTHEQDILQCFITDNGIGRKKAELLNSKSTEKQKSMGIQITSKRLALLNRNMEQTFFEMEDLTDETGNASGTRVTLKIRYQESEVMLPSGQ